MRHFPFTRRAALAAGLLAAAGAAQAWVQPGHGGLSHSMKEPSTLRLSLVDRETGVELPQYIHQGQVYVAGRPGARYSIRLNSQRGDRLLAVVSVDGVNVVSGKTAGFGDSGYVMQPFSRYDITGWRKSDREVAAFEFASLGDSYAARTGRPDNVGVIGVAVFEEKRYEPQVDLRSFNSAPTAPMANKMESRAAAPAGGAGIQAQDSLGTGHGARERSDVSKTTFERASSLPRQVLTIRYDRYENLVAAGVIPQYRPSGPNAFPRSTEPGYVPDPPPRRW